jgi:hypothetical protein
MIGTVTCIYKSGDPTLFNNYRPISILPAFSKVIEKLVSLRLYEYFSKNNIFSHCQFGFMHGLSVVDAVQSLVDYLYDAFDRGEFAVGCFLDLSKAFDSLNREKIFNKLECYGIRGQHYNDFKVTSN